MIEALGAGPVEMFASSGGAVTAFALVAAYPDDVTTLVGHEPPLIPVLPDSTAAERARALRVVLTHRRSPALHAFGLRRGHPGEIHGAEAECEPEQR